MSGGNKKIKTGVILAAGLGSRLSNLNEGTTLKPLILLGGKPLILRTLYSLECAMCNKIIIVLGYKAREVREEIIHTYKGTAQLFFIINEKYNLSNGVSVLSARKYIDTDFLLTMADHVFSDTMMKLAGDHIPQPGGATLLVDYKLDTIFDMDDATKVLSKDDKVIAIGKTIPEFNCIDTGLFVCTEGFMENLAAIYNKKGDASVTNGVQSLAGKDLMRVLDIKDSFWQDVDTPEMLDYAKKRLCSLYDGSN
ncbi:MAG: sugar phosphate nucleotidyltransferase [bacterium]